MRRVACFSATSAVSDGESPKAAVEGLVEAITEWLKSKGLETMPDPDNSTSFQMENGRLANLSIEKFDAQTGHVTDIVLDEQNEYGRFSTRLSIGVKDSALCFFVELRAGGTDLKLRPHWVDARCPHIVRLIFQKREWFIGATPVYTIPIPFHGASGGVRLMDVVHDLQRNLPVVLVSKRSGRFLTPTIAEELAQDLNGLAIVGTVDPAASYEIASRFGREWSCFDGGIRIYWPLQHSPADVFQHPLWTHDRIVLGSDSAEHSASRLRNQLRRRLFGISTYTISEPSDLSDLRSEADRLRFETLREAAKSENDWDKLEELYAKENDDLQKRNEDLLSELQEQKDKLIAKEEYLRAQEMNFRDAIVNLQAVPEEADIAPSPEPKIETIADAIELACSQFSEELEFGTDVLNGSKSLDSRAGPPDKVFTYLQALAEMTRCRRSEGLGKDMIAWLKGNGISASGESDTVLNSPAEMRARTWGDGYGKKRTYEKHLKPTNQTSPDRCVRIYFDYDEALGKTTVGWIGRHPGT